MGKGRRCLYCTVPINVRLGRCHLKKPLFLKKILRSLETWPCYSDLPGEMGTLGTPWPIFQTEGPGEPLNICQAGAANCPIASCSCSVPTVILGPGSLTSVETVITSLPGGSLSHFPRSQGASCTAPQALLAPELWGPQDLGQVPPSYACAKRGSLHSVDPQRGPGSADRRWLQPAPPVSWTCPWVDEAWGIKAGRQAHWWQDYRLGGLNLNTLVTDSDRTEEGVITQGCHYPGTPSP